MDSPPVESACAVSRICDIHALNFRYSVELQNRKSDRTCTSSCLQYLILHAFEWHVAYDIVLYKTWRALRHRRGSAPFSVYEILSPFINDPIRIRSRRYGISARTNQKTVPAGGFNHLSIPMDAW